VFFPLAMLSQYVFGPALFLLSLFIVLIILLQRGRGGGLTGALGGAGGASAFGVKAGDIFTRITAVSVLLWIILCALTTWWYLPPKLDIQSDPRGMGAGGSGASELGLPGSELPPGNPDSVIPFSPNSPNSDSGTAPPAPGSSTPSPAINLPEALKEPVLPPASEPVVPNTALPDPVVPEPKPVVPEPKPS
jgi:preprotein translocase subunit SecG